MVGVPYLAPKSCKGQAGPLDSEQPITLTLVRLTRWLRSSASALFI